MPSPLPSGHPRGCGEHARKKEENQIYFGSSPRVRGTPGRRSGAVDRRRVIPAGAGNTAANVMPSPLPSGHPRGCGEHDLISPNTTAGFGSSPRVRGTRRAGGGPAVRLRVIPAGAGNTIILNRYNKKWTGHPRGCGEHFIILAGIILCCGSSPRVRGTRGKQAYPASPVRVIPAGAGNTLPIKKRHTNKLHSTKKSTNFSC